MWGEFLITREVAYTGWSFGSDKEEVHWTLTSLLHPGGSGEKRIRQMNEGEREAEKNIQESKS